MSQTENSKDDQVCVQELMDLPSQTQAENKAEKFAEISNLYQPLRAEDVVLPNQSDPAPIFESYQIHEKIKRI